MLGAIFCRRNRDDKRFGWRQVNKDKKEKKLAKQ
jgi:hypothetical protein